MHTYYVPVEGYNGAPGWAMFEVQGEDKIDALSAAQRELRGHTYKAVWGPHTECPTVEYMQMLRDASDRRNNR
jgi:hypothetical protein